MIPTWAISVYFVHFYSQEPQYNSLMSQTEDCAPMFHIGNHIKDRCHVSPNIHGNIFQTITTEQEQERWQDAGRVSVWWHPHSGFMRINWMLLPYYGCRKSMVSCQKGPTCHAHAWLIGPFWQDATKFFSWCSQALLQYSLIQVQFIDALHQN